MIKIPEFTLTEIEEAVHESKINKEIYAAPSFHTSDLEPFLKEIEKEVGYIMEEYPEERRSEVVEKTVEAMINLLADSLRYEFGLRKS